MKLREQFVKASQEGQEHRVERRRLTPERDYNRHVGQNKITGAADICCHLKGKKNKTCPVAKYE